MKKTQGIAVVTVLVMLVVVSSLVAISSFLALGNRRSSSDNFLSVQTQYLAEAGIEEGLNKVFWETRKNWLAKDGTAVGAVFDTCAFRKWLTGTVPASADSVANKANNSVCPPVGAAVNAATGLVAGVPNLWNNNTDVTAVTKANISVQSGAVGNYTVRVKRLDDPITSELSLTISSDAEIKNSSGDLLARKQLSRTLKIGTEAFSGDRYALLTNLVNCALCHLRVDSMRRAYETDTTKSFDRVRMGAIGTDQLNFNFGGHNTDTVVAGTLYSRSSDAPANADSANSQVWALPWDPTNGQVKAGATSTDLIQMGVADTDAKKDAAAYDTSLNKTKSNARLYYKYPTPSEVVANYSNKWPDGELPETFPNVITDPNKDGLVSDAEWTAYLSTAQQGTLTANGGAVIYGVQRPSTASGSTLPISYDPVTADSIAGTTPPTLTTNNSLVDTTGLPLLADARAAQTELDNLVASASNFKGWLIRQALASPNNRDYLPSRGISTVSRGGAFLNNLYVRFNAANSTLYLTFCRYIIAGVTVATATNANRVAANQCVSPGNLQSISLTLTSSDLFPNTSNADTIMSTTGKLDGNAILDGGTLSGNSYFDLAGTVYINGDVVLRGLIRGQGRIIARGNIYIVGDFVYACDNPPPLTTKRACKISDYKNPDYLPRIALLAGGSILVGDYDAPDFRTNFRQQDLINDQTYQMRSPASHVIQANWGSGNFLGWSREANTNRIPFAYYNIPGATGHNYNGVNSVNGTGAALPVQPGSGVKSISYGTGDTTGFIPRLLGSINNRTNNLSTGGRYFMSNPFGFMLKDGDAAGYEGWWDNNNAFVSDVNSKARTIIPLYPSNGPILIGNRTSRNDGLETAISGVTCWNNNTTLANQPVRQLQSAKFASNMITSNVGVIMPDSDTSRFDYTTSVTPVAANFNFGFWCPQNAGTYLRAQNAPAFAATTTPANDMNAWQLQSTQNGLLDGGLGMSTGWLGGILAGNQIGDLSQTRLLKMMWLATTESSARDADPDVNGTGGPLRTDGIFYSGHAIFALTRYYKDLAWDSDNISEMQGRWIHNGSVIAAELGFLMTGDIPRGNVAFNQKGFGTITNFAKVSASQTASDTDGAGLTILYDDRLSGLLQIESGKPVRIRRSGIFTQVPK